MPRRKPTVSLKRSKTVNDLEEEDEDLFGDRMEDVGLVHALVTDLTLRDVAQAIPYILSHQFSPLPAQRSGMNSTRIAEVLNFRKNLPPIVTVPHVQALLNSPTTVEREIAELVRAGVVKKIVVPGRGTMGEALVLMKHIEDLIEASTMDVEVKARFLAYLHNNPSVMTISRDELSDMDKKALMQAGFLTSAIKSWKTIDVYSQPGDAMKGTATSIEAVSRAASGSIAAVGGEGAVHASGGTGGGVSLPSFGNFNLAIPSTGAYLKLLTAAKAHLVSLLGKARYREMTIDMLKEKWDGGIEGDDKAGEARRIRGEFAAVSPGKTRKWKIHYGIRFEWILEECVGAGLMEVFETKSVGRGVRMI